MPDDQKQYGKTISKAEADAMFSSFLQMKLDTHAELQAAFAQKPAALRYYCGSTGMGAALDDHAYVFDKACLTRLLEQLEGTDPMADGIIVFNGVRKDPVEGRPTVMLFPYKYEDRDNEKKIEVMTDLGAEHPGTSAKVVLKYELPSVFESTETYE